MPRFPAISSGESVRTLYGAGPTFTASMSVPTAWSTTALPLGVGVDTTVGSAFGLASKVRAWAGRAATNEAASRVAVAAFSAPAVIHASGTTICAYRRHQACLEILWYHVIACSTGAAAQAHIKEHLCGTAYCVLGDLRSAHRSTGQPCPP